MVKMITRFNSAMKKLEECMTELGKGVEELVDDIFTEKEDGTTRIKIKKGSIVFIGNGVYAKLSQDVEAEIVEKKEEEKKSE